jgi:Uncharacterized conserved protein
MLISSLYRFGQWASRTIRGRREPTSTLAPAAAARQLHHEILAQARSAVFYEAFGVPDTPDGRFDMIALHAALVMRRLRADPTVSPAVAQFLFDQMFAGFDESLREMGVGDLRVGKVVKALAKGFYGRLAVYGSCLDAVDHQGLQDALRRNVYRHCEPDRNKVSALTDYVFAEAEWLAQRSGEHLLAEGVRFRVPVIA